MKKEKSGINGTPIIIFLVILAVFLGVVIVKTKVEMEAGRLVFEKNPFSVSFKAEDGKVSWKAGFSVDEMVRFYQKDHYYSTQMSVSPSVILKVERPREIFYKKKWDSPPGEVPKK
jgi:hypothetical protein